MDPNDIRQQPLIVNAIYVGGLSITQRDPLAVVTPRNMSAITQTSNLGRRKDRPFVAVGMPDERDDSSISLPWPNLLEAGALETLDQVAASGQPVTLCWWKHRYDFWSGDGSNKTFYLQGRQILPIFTPTAGGGHLGNIKSYQTRIQRWSGTRFASGSTLTQEYNDDNTKLVHKTSSTINTGIPASDECWIEDDGHLDSETGLRISTVRFGTAPANANGCAVAMYIPGDEYVIAKEDPRPYDRPNLESRGFTFVRLR